MIDGVPYRRDVLETLAGGGITGLLRLSDAVDAGELGNGAPAAQADVGRVVDIDDNGVPAATVHAFRLADGSGDGAVEHLGSTGADDDGRFGVGSTDDQGEAGGIRTGPVSPDAGDVAVLLVAHWQGEADGTDRPPEWFGNRIYDPDDFLNADSYAVTLDRRLLFHETVRKEAPRGDLPYGTVTIWEDFKARIFDDSTIRMEARSLRDWDPDETGGGRVPSFGDDELDDTLEYEATLPTALTGGLFSLQFPEDVDHSYRALNEEEDGVIREPQPESLFWTDAPTLYRSDVVAGHVGETSALTAIEDLPVPLYGVLPPSESPRFDEQVADGSIRPDNFLSEGPWIDINGEPQNVSYFIPYWSGGEQAAERQEIRQGFEVLSLGIGVLSLIPGVGVIVSVGFAAASTGVGLINAASGPGPSVPDSAKQENRTDIGSGYLDFDRGAYDFVTNGFRYETQAANQVFTLEDVSTPVRVCARGLFRFERRDNPDRSDASDPEVEIVDLEHGFEINPLVHSPLDDDGVRIVSGTEEGSVDPVRLSTPFISGPSSTLIDESVSFEATPIATFEGTAIEPDVDGYDWTIARRDLDPFEGGRPTGEIIDEEITDASRKTISHEFETPGEYAVSVTVTDGDETASATQTVEVTEPPLEAVPPVDTDAGEQCVHPTDGDSVPATGDDAASFIAPGWCGTWKEYEATSGYEHVVRTRVDGCEDCVLHNASYEIQEPIDGEWQTVRTVTEPRGKAFADSVHELRYTPSSDRFRVKNRYDQPDEGRNLGIGFYVTVLAPQFDDSGDDDGNEDA